MNCKLVNIFYFLVIIMLSVSGADRINLLSNKFESFILTPYLLFSIIIIVFIVTFFYHDINFNWIKSNKLSFQFFSIFIITAFISVLLSDDIISSIKRIILLLIIIINSILVISCIKNNDLKKIIYNSSILGSIIFLIFNFVIIFLWFKYNNLDFSSYINLKPNMISYFIPRLGGYTSDVNRGGVVLLFFTFYLYTYKRKSKYINFLILINVISLILTMSRTVYLLSFITIFVYTLNDNVDKKRLIKYTFSGIFISILTLIYLDDIKIIELDYLLKERLTIDYDLNRFSSSGIHLRLIYEGLTTALTNIKILLFGNGFGTSFLLIHGYYWSGTKYANYHSLYITLLVEIGILGTVSFIFYSFLIPIFKKMYSTLFPLVIGLFFYNIFYQIIVEPIYWFIILLFYKENETLKN